MMKARLKLHTKIFIMIKDQMWTVNRRKKKKTGKKRWTEDITNCNLQTLYTQFVTDKDLSTVPPKTAEDITAAAEN